MGDKTVGEVFLQGKISSIPKYYPGKPLWFQLCYSRPPDEDEVEDIVYERVLVGVYGEKVDSYAEELNKHKEVIICGRLRSSSTYNPIRRQSEYKTWVCTTEVTVVEEGK